MAGALDIALAGPRAYPGYTVDDPYMNRDGRKQVTANDIDRAVVVMIGASGVQALLVLLIAVLVR